MKIKKKTEEQNHITLEVLFDPDEFERALDTAYRRNRDPNPGFERVSKKEFINSFRDLSALAAKMLPFYKEDLIEFAEIEAAKDEVYLSPRVTFIDWDYSQPDETVVAKVEWFKKPSITIPELSDYFPEELDIQEVEDGEIEEILDNMQYENRRLIPKEGSAGPNDTISVDIILDSNGIFNKEEDVIIDLNDLDNEYITFFYTDRSMKQLKDDIKAGNEIVFVRPSWIEDNSLTFHVNDVYESEFDEIDDEFASEVSEFDTLEELKEDLRRQLYENRLNEWLDDQILRILKEMVLDAEIDLEPEYLPDSLEDFDISFEQANRNFMELANSTDGFSGLDTVLLDEVIVSLPSLIAEEFCLQEDSNFFNDESGEERLYKLVQRVKENPDDYSELMNEYISPEHLDLILESESSEEQDIQTEELKLIFSRAFWNLQAKNLIKKRLKERFSVD